jgi:hypothetical protein
MGTFIKQVEKIITDAGGNIKNESGSISTKYGKYLIKSIEPKTRSDRTWSIIGRFLDKKHFEAIHRDWQSNRVSGKKNFIYFDEDLCLDIFKRFIDDIV